MGDKVNEKLNKLGDKVIGVVKRHPYAASAVCLVGASALTVGLYKYFGKIVAKEVVKALI